MYRVDTAGVLSFERVLEHHRNDIHVLLPHPTCSHSVITAGSDGFIFFSDILSSRFAPSVFYFLFSVLVQSQATSARVSISKS